MRTSRTARLLAVISAVLFLGTIVACGNGPNSSSAPKDPDSSVDFVGRKFAQDLITPHLKSPTTADFPDETVKVFRMESITHKFGVAARRWKVVGAVDAQNSFGARIRGSWEVIVLHLPDKDKFIPAEASLDGTQVFSSELYQNMLADQLGRSDAKQKADAADRVEREKGKAAAKAKLDAEESARRRAAQKAIDDEKAPQIALDLAKQLLKAGKDDKAIERLRRIVKDYPDTPAAKDAAQLLKKLGG
jgi:hypothetical protein